MTAPTIFLFAAACAAPFGSLIGIKLAYWLDSRQQEKEARIEREKSHARWLEYLAEEARKPKREPSHPILRGDIRDIIDEAKRRG